MTMMRGVSEDVLGWLAEMLGARRHTHTHTEVLLRRTVLDGSELLFVKYETMSNVRSAENLLDG